MSADTIGRSNQYRKIEQSDLLPNFSKYIQYSTVKQWWRPPCWCHWGELAHTLLKSRGAPLFDPIWTREYLLFWASLAPSFLIQLESTAHLMTPLFYAVLVAGRVERGGYHQLRRGLCEGGLPGGLHQGGQVPPLDTEHAIACNMLQRGLLGLTILICKTLVKWNKNQNYKFNKARCVIS